MRFDDIDLSDLDRFSRGFPHEVFSFLREEAPVWWHPPTEHTPAGEGFWVVSDMEHLLEVNRSEVFSSESGGNREGGGTLIEDLPRGFVVGAMLNMSEGETHSRLRGLVSRTFTPRAMARLEDDLRQRTRVILDRIVEQGGECDFVRDVARELPLQVIAEMLGIPQADRHHLFDCAMASLEYEDRELGESTPAMAKASAMLLAYGVEHIEAKRRSPDDSIFSHVIHATREGEGGSVPAMSEMEIRGFFSLLFAAGSDTTRNAITGGLLALMEHPDELARLQGQPDLLPSAIEELLRYVSPVTYNRRTATRTVELGGKTIAAGDKVTHWYPSANRDARVFEDPFRLDLSRDPNPHVTFNIGRHFCLGASLARREMHVMFEELLARFASFEQTGPVVHGRSNKHGNYRQLPVRMKAR